MKSNRFSSLGWVVAVALGALMLAGGFQQNGTKIGVVDLNKVMTESKIQQDNLNKLRTALDLRQGLIKFIQDNPIITEEQAERIRTLTLAERPTDADKTALESTKQEVIRAVRDFDALNQKPTPTDEERARLRDYNTRRDGASRIEAGWRNQFNEDLGTIREDLQQSTIDAARKAAQEVAKKDGFTVVFESQVAIYSANDITQATINQMNAG